MWRRLTGIPALPRLPRFYLLLCVAAMIVPLWPSSEPARDSGNAVFPGWPQEYEGKALTSQELSPREQRFYRDFDGCVAKFSDGGRQIVMRWTDSATRKFHLFERCYQAIGYDVQAIPMRLDREGRRWRAFMAKHPREKATVRVCERICDTAGNEWTDESAWRWACFWKQTVPPWYSMTIAEPAD